MQVVTYPSLGSAEGSKYISTAVQVLQKIQRESPNQRALRRWMRGQEILDKDAFDLLAKLIDFKIAANGEVSVGNFGKALIEADEAQRQDLIFEKIASSNEILVKYVFDALQERLYSTSELYRMLTSYVYPGKEIDLPHFNLWLKWMASTDRVRILGIRWAPGKRFEASAVYIKSIDVDEILEEEAEEVLMGEVGGSEPAEEDPPAEAEPVKEETSPPPEAEALEAESEAPAAPSAPVERAAPVAEPTSSASASL